MDVLHRTGPELTPAELYDLLRLRSAVFVVEQASPYQELDGRDLEQGTSHLWLADEAGVVASIRVLSEPGGAFRIGRVVTRPDRRGEGWSSRLLVAALKLVDGATTVLDAQSHLLALYERFGFAVSGPEFVEDGIPHLPMARPSPVGPQRPSRADPTGRLTR